MPCVDSPTFVTFSLSKFPVTLHKNSLIAFLSGNFEHGDILKRHVYLEGHKPAVTQALQKHDLYVMFSAFVRTCNSSSRAVKNIYLLEAATVAKELC